MIWELKVLIETKNENGNYPRIDEVKMDFDNLNDLMRMVRDIQRHHTAEAVEYVIKPIEFKELIDDVEEALNE